MWRAVRRCTEPLETELATKTEEAEAAIAAAVIANARAARAELSRDSLAELYDSEISRQTQAKERIARQQKALGAAKDKLAARQQTLDDGAEALDAARATQAAAAAKERANLLAGLHDLERARAKLIEETEAVRAARASGLRSRNTQAKQRSRAKQAVATQLMAAKREAAAAVATSAETSQRNVELEALLAAEQLPVLESTEEPGFHVAERDRQPGAPRRYTADFKLAAIHQLCVGTSVGKTVAALRGFLSVQGDTDNMADLPRSTSTVRKVRDVLFGMVLLHCHDLLHPALKDGETLALEIQHDGSEKGTENRASFLACGIHVSVYGAQGKLVRSYSAVAPIVEFLGADCMGEVLTVYSALELVYLNKRLCDGEADTPELRLAVAEDRCRFVIGCRSVLSDNALTAAAASGVIKDDHDRGQIVLLELEEPGFAALTEAEQHAWLDRVGKQMIDKKCFMHSKQNSAGATPQAIDWYTNMAIEQHVPAGDGRGEQGDAWVPPKEGIRQSNYVIFHAFFDPTNHGTGKYHKLKVFLADATREGYDKHDAEILRTYDTMVGGRFMQSMKNKAVYMALHDPITPFIAHLATLQKKENQVNIPVQKAIIEHRKLDRYISFLLGGSMYVWYHGPVMFEIKHFNNGYQCGEHLRAVQQRLALLLADGGKLLGECVAAGTGLFPPGFFAFNGNASHLDINTTREGVHVEVVKRLKAKVLALDADQLAAFNGMLRLVVQTNMEFNNHYFNDDVSPTGKHHPSVLSAPAQAVYKSCGQATNCGSEGILGMLDRMINDKSDRLSRKYLSMYSQLHKNGFAEHLVSMPKAEQHALFDRADNAAAIAAVEQHYDDHSAKAAQYQSTRMSTLVEKNQAKASNKKVAVDAALASPPMRWDEVVARRLEINVKGGAVAANLKAFLDDQLAKYTTRMVILETDDKIAFKTMMLKGQSNAAGRDLRFSNLEKLCDMYYNQHRKWLSDAAAVKKVLGQIDMVVTKLGNISSDDVTDKISEMSGADGCLGKKLASLKRARNINDKKRAVYQHARAEPPAVEPESTSAGQQASKQDPPAFPTMDDAEGSGGWYMSRVTVEDGRLDVAINTPYYFHRIVTGGASVWHEDPRAPPPHTPLTAL